MNAYIRRYLNKLLEVKRAEYAEAIDKKDEKTRLILFIDIFYLGSYDFYIVNRDAWFNGAFSMLRSLKDFGFLNKEASKLDIAKIYDEMTEESER